MLSSQWIGPGKQHTNLLLMISKEVIGKWEIKEMKEITWMNIWMNIMNEYISCSIAWNIFSEPQHFTSLSRVKFGTIFSPVHTITTLRFKDFFPIFKNLMDNT